MPKFNVEDSLDIDPDEYLSSCSSHEIKEVIEILTEDGHLDRSETIQSLFTKANVNDEKYWDSLNHLKRFRHLLSLEEENYINSLAEKFKHL